MSKFKAGDLCEIIDHPDWKDDTRKFLHHHVILICSIKCRETDTWAPRWRVAGIPKNNNVSEKVLRKIPPPCLEDELIQELEHDT